MATGVFDDTDLVEEQPQDGQETLAEAQRRGISLSSADNKVSAQTKDNIAAMHNVIARIQGAAK